MTPSVAPVLVAGGGPTGLAIALTLLENHVPVRIIDKEPHYRIGQRGSGIWPRTFEAFHFLRAHDIYQRATPVLPIQEYKPGTLEVAKTVPLVAHNDPTPSVPYNNPRFLGQPVLEGILRSHLENKYGCSLELGTELQSFEDDGERVLAKLVKRTDGEDVCETVEASYLVGADGGKGVTRKQLGLTFFGETEKEFACLVGDICFEVEGIDRKHWHFFGKPSADFLSFRPTNEIAPDGFQFILSVKDYEPKQLIADEKLMFECMSKLIGCDINVRKIVILSEFRPNIRMANKFSVGRVFIAGDAAHVHSPTGGQGLNSCVQDALNLGWKLALVHRGLSPATLLDSYTQERLPIIAEMLNLTTGILHKMRAAHSAEQVMEREKKLNMLGVNYRTSPIVIEEFTQAEPVNVYRGLDESELVAGDRAPDAPGLVAASRGVETEVETRLFDVFSATYHTVVVFAPDVAAGSDVLEVLERYARDVVRPLIVLPRRHEGAMVVQADVVVDRDGHAYRAYLTADGEKKVVVVRPDGVVGAIVHGAEGVKTYLANIFV